MSADWPDITHSLRTSLTWPQGVTLDLQVLPCGEEAWEVHLVIWAKEIPSGYEALHVRLDDCLDVSKFRGIGFDPRRFSSPDPECLVSDVGMAFAYALCDITPIVTIEHASEERGKDPAVELRLRTRFYESSALCSWQEFVQHVHE